MKILVTGGCGFIGSNFLLRLLHGDAAGQVTNLDKLTYAGNPENLREIENDPRYSFIRADIADQQAVQEIIGTGDFEAVVNFAAESHVDRSIEDASQFVATNVTGTQVLLEACRGHKVKRFLQVSTDEVYGSLGPEGRFSEESVLAPNSPYAASKAAADLFVRAYWETYRYPCIITRCSNNYGPFQFPEKFLPLMITQALQGQALPIYGDGLYTRDWIHVEDHCAALETILNKGKPGEVYNIGGDSERKNIDLAKAILELVGKPDSLIEHVPNRPGHDRRYAVDAEKLQRQLGWKPQWTLEEGLQKTIDWYRNHETWWRRIIQGDYLVDRKAAEAKKSSRSSGMDS
ncbi:MAG: dTDP-glucose 4,6-dehydratase [Acidobacteriota bacterium]